MISLVSAKKTPKSCKAQLWISLNLGQRCHQRPGRLALHLGSNIIDSPQSPEIAFARQSPSKFVSRKWGLLPLRIPREHHKCLHMFMKVYEDGIYIHSLKCKQTNQQQK